MGDPIGPVYTKGQRQSVTKIVILLSFWTDSIVFNESRVVTTGPWGISIVLSIQVLYLRLNSVLSRCAGSRPDALGSVGQVTPRRPRPRPSPAARNAATLEATRRTMMTTTTRE